MTSSPPKADDVCGVCETTREDHGDRHHEFNMDGDLKPLPPAPKPRAEAPKPRAEGDAVDKLLSDPTANMALRLVETLTSKGLIDGPEVVYIMGGGVIRAPHRGAAGEAAEADHSEEAPS